MDSLPQEDRRTSAEPADDVRTAPAGPSSPRPRTIGLIAAVALVAVAGVGVYFAARHRPGGPSAREIYDLSKYKVTDPRLILYREVKQFPTGFQEATCLALGPGGELYVGGDEAVRILDADGRQRKEVRLPGTPLCLAVAEDGMLYVGLGVEVLVLDPKGAVRTKWSYGPKAILTGIALTEARAFVADAGARLVHIRPLPDATLRSLPADRQVARPPPAGKLRSTSGEPGKLATTDEDTGDDGLIIYGPYLDVAVGEDGLVRVVDPGRHRVKLYAPEGALLSVWKSNPSISIRGFSGCCNPAHIALLPDGSVVTSEKGIPRVKVYSADGEFVGVVAGPESFGAGARKAPDIAVDEKGRIVVLDRGAATVRVFVKNGTTQ